MSAPTSTRVLIVEDNLLNRELMDYLLRSFGFETLMAVDGGIGLDIARRELPDLILCDIQMPVVDGLEFARQAKADDRLRGIPLVAVTALAMVGDRTRILSMGFDGYVAKPIEPAQFVTAVRQFLPEALRCDAAPQSPTAYRPKRAERAATILVFDDTPFNLELKRDLLEPHGYRVHTADTVARALELARAQVPDLIISDVGNGGFEFITEAKADPRLRDVPFMFLSATHWESETKAHGLALGAVRYLERPLEPLLLLREIEACLRGGSSSAS
jgi:two-component system cell cycle response regulator